MTRSVQDAASGAQTIAGSIGTVAAQAKQVAAGSEEALTAARSLASTSSDMQGLVREYRVS